MKRVPLAGMQVSPIGLGAWAIGGEWEYGWGPQDERVSIDTIHRALELGVNWIDTAAVYGLGRSEAVVGRALRGSGDRPLVFTKGGIPWNAAGEPTHRLSRDSLLREFDASCQRLGVDVVDLYQIHWPIPDEEVEPGVETLAELREQGRIRFVGVSNFSADQLRRAAAITRVDVLQSPYSLIDRALEESVLPYCVEHGIDVINYSPMASGLLTGKVTREWLQSLDPNDWRRTKADHFREPALSENLAVADRVREVAQRHNAFPGAVAVAWTLRHRGGQGRHRRGAAARPARRRRAGGWHRTLRRRGRVPPRIAAGRDRLERVARGPD